jgi:PAS domain S-box-containing protein
MQQKKLQRVVVVGKRGEMLGIVTQTTLLNALNPLEIYKVVEILEQKVSRLEAENIQLLQQQKLELEVRVKARTAALVAQIKAERLLARMDKRIQTCFNLQEILDAAVVELRGYLNCNRVVVYQFASDMSGLIVSESVRYPYLSSLYEQINDTCFQKNLGRSYREGRICAITDVDAAGLSDCHLKLLQEFQVQANLVVPVILSASHADLMTENALWGLLVAHQCDRPRQWQTEEIDLVQKMSVQLALAVQQNLAYYHLRLQKSKRNQVELNLQESEQKYLSLVRSLPVGVFRTDVDGHCLYVNDRWCQIAGLGVEAAAGFGWIASLHPDDCQLVVDEWYASTEAERPFSLEYRFVNAEGKITWVYGQATAERNAEGKIIGYVGSITDISDRKRLEAERQETEAILQENEERWRLALAAANQGLYDLNVQTGEAIVNDEYATMLGYEPTEFRETNEDWVERLHPNDLERVRHNYLAYIAGEISEYKVEFRQHTKTGDWKWNRPHRE